MCPGCCCPLFALRSGRVSPGALSVRRRWFPVRGRERSGGLVVWARWFLVWGGMVTATRPLLAKHGARFGGLDCRGLRFDWVPGRLGPPVWTRCRAGWGHTGPGFRFVLSCDRVCYGPTHSSPGLAYEGAGLCWPTSALALSSCCLLRLSGIPALAYSGSDLLEVWVFGFGWVWWVGWFDVPPVLGWGWFGTPDPHCSLRGDQVLVAQG